MIKKFNDFDININEENVLQNVRNKIKNFGNFGLDNFEEKKQEIKNLLKSLAHKNDGVEFINDGVKITSNDSVYFVGNDGQVKFPAGSEIYLDIDDAKEIINSIPRPRPPRRMSPPEKIEFPCGYYFLTKELKNRLKEKEGPIGIIPDGYGFYCETPEQLEEYKEKYKVGNKYNGETITHATLLGEKEVVRYENI